jgi:transcriptional regulator with XRE-family HTH domain
MLLRHAIGSVLRRLRLQRGWTLRRLAEESRISVPYLSELERGRKEASSEILATLCRVLDISERQLLRETDAEYADAEGGRRGLITSLPIRSDSDGRTGSRGSSGVQLAA